MGNSASTNSSISPSFTTTTTIQPKSIESVFEVKPPTTQTESTTTARKPTTTRVRPTTTAKRSTTISKKTTTTTVKQTTKIPNRHEGHEEMDPSGNHENENFNPDNGIDAIDPYDEQPSTSDGQRKFRGYGTHGMSWSGGYNGQYPIYQTNGQYPANGYQNGRYPNGNSYAQYPENGIDYPQYPDYNNNHDQNPGNYHEQHPLPNGYHYGTASPYDYNIHYAYPSENNYNQQYPGARDPPTNSRYPDTYQPNHFPGNLTPRNIPPTVVSSNQPKKVIFDWTPFAQKWQNNMTSNDDSETQNQKLKQLYDVADTYYSDHLNSKMDKQLGENPQKDLILFGETFSKPKKGSGELESDFNHRYKKIIYDYLTSEIQEALIYQNSNENKNMLIDFNGNCTDELKGELYYDINGILMQYVENTDTDIQVSVSSSNIKIFHNSDNSIYNLYSNNYKEKFKDAIDWMLNSEYVESNIIGFWHFNITGEDYLLLNELFKKHHSIEPVFLFYNCKFDIAGFEYLNLPSLERIKNDLIFLNTKMNPLIGPIISKRRSNLGKFTIFSCTNDSNNETLITNQ